MQLTRQLLEQPTLLAYLLGANNYTWIQFRNGEKRLIAKPLTYFEEQLPDFVRIHKTAIVNPVCVVAVQPPPRPKMAGSLQMSDSTVLPVSRRRWPQLKELLATQPAQEAEPAVLSASAGDEVIRVTAIMSGDALLVTQRCVSQLAGKPGVTYAVQALDRGAELASALLLDDPEQWPTLVLLDARTNRPDRLLTLRALKEHPRLRAIPVVWLTTTTENATALYEMGANSIVAAPHEAAAFRQVVDQLCVYWLQMVQLPTEAAEADTD